MHDIHITKKLKNTHNLLLKDLSKSRDSLKKRIVELSTSNVNLGGAIQGVASELQQTRFQHDELKEEISKELPKGIETVFISSVAQQGITELKDLLWKYISVE